MKKVKNSSLSRVFNDLNWLLKVRNWPFWKILRPHKRRYALGLVTLTWVDVINDVLPLVIKYSIDAIATREMHKVYWAAFAFFALMSIQSLGRYLWRMYLIGTSHQVASELRTRLYAHFQRLPLKYYHSVRTGDLMSRATNDIESVRMAVGPGVLVSADAVLMFILIVPVMFVLSPKLTLMTLAFFPIVPWLTTKVGDKIDKLFGSLQEEMSKMSAYTQESFWGIRLIKSLVLEALVLSRFTALSERYRKQGLQLAKSEAVFSPALSLITHLGTFLILLFGGWDVLSGAISVGTFVAFQRYVVQLSWPMEAIGWAVTMTREGVAAYRRYEEILEVDPVQDIRSQATQESGEALLEMKNLSYSHGSNGMGRMHIDSLKLLPGQKIGLVGPVGSGKTTLFNLILRLIEPGVGTIFFRGRDVTSLPLQRLRNQIGSVEQQIFLFSETIADNITQGSLVPCTRKEIEEVARCACIHDEIEELEKKYDTVLGERGVNLSGGQKQRIALVRALIRRPTVLLLDDAFSAVDLSVEQKVIENLFEKYSDLALVFSSHRLSVMTRMDSIWLLDQGQVKAVGTHEELMKGCDLYRELWEKSEAETIREKYETGVTDVRF